MLKLKMKPMVLISNGGEGTKLTTEKRSERVKLFSSVTMVNTRDNTMDQCFKIHGYLDWYEGNKSKSTKKIAAPVYSRSQDFESELDSPLSNNNGSTNGNMEAKVDNALVQAVYQEVMKAQK